MNVHAHLFTNEIIGYNCGYILKAPEDKNILVVHDSNICQPLEDIGADRTKTVEMNPESARLAYNKALNRDQSIIGWYHSHPQFEVDPSNIDVMNHNAYQAQFNKDNKPFMALIVGTYSQTIEPTGLFTSLLKCFHLTGEKGKNMDPYDLDVNIIPQDAVDSHVLDDISNLLDDPDIDQNLTGYWRDEMTKYQKFKKCLRNLSAQNTRDMKRFSYTEITDKSELSKHYEGVKMDPKCMNTFLRSLKHVCKKVHQGEEVSQEELQKEIDEAPKGEKMIPTQEFLQKVIDLMDTKLKTILAKKPSSPPVVTMQDFNFSCDGSSLQNYRSSSDDDAVSKNKKRKRRKSDIDDDYKEDSSENKDEGKKKNRSKSKRYKGKKFTKAQSMKVDKPKNKREEKDEGKKKEAKEESKSDGKKTAVKRNEKKKKSGKTPQFPPPNEVSKLIAKNGTSGGKNNAPNANTKLPNLSKIKLPSFTGQQDNPIHNLISGKMKQNLFTNFIRNQQMGLGQPGAMRNFGQMPFQSDPSLVAQTFYTELNKNQSDIHQKQQILTQNRSNFMQQALASMFAATNLYQLMHKSNWASKPPESNSNPKQRQSQGGRGKTE